MGSKYYSVTTIFNIDDLTRLSSNEKLRATDSLLEEYLSRLEVVLTRYDRLRLTDVSDLVYQQLKKRLQHLYQAIMLLNASPGFTESRDTVIQRPQLYIPVGREGLVLLKDVLDYVDILHSNITSRRSRVLGRSPDYKVIFWGDHSIILALLSTWICSLALITKVNTNPAVRPWTEPARGPGSLAALASCLDSLSITVMQSGPPVHPRLEEAITHVEKLSQALQNVNAMAMLTTERGSSNSVETPSPESKPKEVRNQFLAVSRIQEQIDSMSVSTRHAESKISTDDNVDTEDTSSDEMDIELVGHFITNGEKTLSQGEYQFAEENFREAQNLMDEDGVNLELTHLKIGVMLHLCHSLVPQSKTDEALDLLKSLLGEKALPKTKRPESWSSTSTAPLLHGTKLERDQLIRARYLAGLAFAEKDCLVEAEENALAAFKYARKSCAKDDKTFVYCVILPTHVYESMGKQVKAEAYRQFLPRGPSGRVVDTDRGQARIMAEVPIPMLSKINRRSSGSAPIPANGSIIQLGISQADAGYPIKKQVIAQASANEDMDASSPIQQTQCTSQ